MDASGPFCGQPLDGRDLLPFELGGEHQAGQAGFAVHEDRAGPAFAAAAAFLGSRQSQVLAQQIDDPAIRRRLDGRFCCRSA